MFKRFHRPAKLTTPQPEAVKPEVILAIAEPTTPVAETPQPEARSDEDENKPALAVKIVWCAKCGNSEAIHPVNVGWFYLGRLPYVGVCDACHAVAKQKEAQHHLSQKKTMIRVPAVNASTTPLEGVQTA